MRRIYTALAALAFTLFLALLLLGGLVLVGMGVLEGTGLSGLFSRGDAQAPPPAATVAGDTASTQSSGAAATPVPGATPTLSPDAEREAAIQRAEDAISQADEPGPFTIEVSDGDLTALLGELLSSLDNPPVSNFVVTFEQDTFVARGTFTSPFRATVETTGHFVVGEDTVQIEFTEARMGAFLMPEALRDQLTEQANTFLAREVGPARRLRIDSVEIVPGKIIVTGERLER